MSNQKNGKSTEPNTLVHEKTLNDTVKQIAENFSAIEPSMPKEISEFFTEQKLALPNEKVMQAATKAQGISRLGDFTAKKTPELIKECLDAVCDQYKALNKKGKKNEKGRMKIGAIVRFLISGGGQYMSYRNIN